MTQEQVYKVLNKNISNIPHEDYIELIKVIGAFGLAQWKEGKEDVKFIYNINQK
jgi:hypothetical protein